MPGMNGIYVGNELKRANNNIIIFIVTSYSEYLDEAMRFHVFRYLSKPLDKQRFFRNMKDAVDLYNTITIKIPVETKQGMHTLPASSVIAIEAQGRKITVHTTLCDFESIHNMQYWLELLPKNRFFQTHRSFIINFEHVTDFDRNLVHMSDNQPAYLTKRKYSLLFFQFSCRSNYTLAILLPFIFLQTHSLEKAYHTLQLIFYPVFCFTV